jgi:small-conductance mechanosensitive channel
VDVTSSILEVVLGIITAIVLLLCLKVDIYALLIPLGTAFLALSFAYGNTFQDMFNSLHLLYFGECCCFVLIFPVRPFNIGDHISISKPAK